MNEKKRYRFLGSRDDDDDDEGKKVPLHLPVLPLTESHAADQQGRDNHALDHF